MKISVALTFTRDLKDNQSECFVGCVEGERENEIWLHSRFQIQTFQETDSFQLKYSRITFSGLKTEYRETTNKVL